MRSVCTGRKTTVGSRIHYAIQSPADRSSRLAVLSAHAADAHSISPEPAATNGDPRRAQRLHFSSLPCQPQYCSLYEALVHATVSRVSHATVSRVLGRLLAVQIIGCDQSPDRFDVGEVEDPSAIFPLDCHLSSSSLPKTAPERKLFPTCFGLFHWTTPGRGLRRFEQLLRLAMLQDF